MLIKNGCSAAVFFVLWVSRHRACAADFALLHSCYVVGCTHRCRRFALPGVAPPRLRCCALAVAFVPPHLYHRFCVAALVPLFCTVGFAPCLRHCTCTAVPVPRCRCARTTGFAPSYFRRNKMPRADNKPCLRAAFFKILCL